MTNDPKDLSNLIQEIKHQALNHDFEQHGQEMIDLFKNQIKNMKNVCKEVDKKYEELLAKSS